MVLNVSNNLKDRRMEHYYTEYTQPTNNILQLHYLDIVIYITSLLLNVYPWSLVYSCILACSICDTIQKVYFGSYYPNKSIIPLFVLLLIINQTEYISELYLKSLGLLILSLKNYQSKIFE
jgi:hypothetical protein